MFVGRLASILNRAVPGWGTATAEPHVMDALREKRSELNGIASHQEQQVVQHCASLVRLDAAMRPFDPDLAPGEAGSRQQHPRSTWFHAGECLRLIHDVLREAPQPMTQQIGQPVGLPLRPRGSGASARTSSNGEMQPRHLLAQLPPQRSDIGRLGHPPCDQPASGGQHTCGDWLIAQRNQNAFGLAVGGHAVRPSRRTRGFSPGLCGVLQPSETGARAGCRRCSARSRSRRHGSSCAAAASPRPRRQ